MAILVTGGAGYIGSHTALQLLQQDHAILVLDNLSNASLESLNRVEKLAGKPVTFVEGDIRDRDLLNRLFANNNIDAVIHFAGLKAVGESVAEPGKYYDNNVYGSLVLFEAMARHDVKKLVFSSSATVYGDPIALPLDETMPTGRPTNPYGRSKLMIEDMLRDYRVADDSWQIVLLRYFNPVGAHESGQIGEDPNGIPNNLMPFITQVACGQREKLAVFGDDYDTPDGTGVRDYIHVEDLARGHLRALDALDKHPGLLTVNLGTGQGYSVLDMVRTFSEVNRVDVPYAIAERRSGDVASCYADPSYAKTVLNWAAEKDLKDMCRDAWRWQSQNPKGYL